MKNTANMGAAAQPGTKIVLLSLPIGAGEKVEEMDRKPALPSSCCCLSRWKIEKDELYTPKRHSCQLFIRVKVMQGLRYGHI